jgi:coenzyme F420-dependent glucose-6-phosphate dehydrogenase
MVPGSARFAGQHGDGLITVGGQQPDMYKQIIAEFDAGARAAGKDPSGMPKLIELNVAYTDDEESALDCMLKYWASTFIPALFDQKIYTPAMAQQNGEAVGREVVKGKMCLSANVDDHVRYAQQHLDLGFTHLFFHCAGPDQAQFLRDYGRDVLPRIREGVRKAA